MMMKTMQNKGQYIDELMKRVYQENEISETMALKENSMIQDLLTNYILQFPQGIRAYAQYYAYMETLMERIEKEPKPKQCYYFIYKMFVEPMIRRMQHRDFDGYVMFCRMVEYLLCVYHLTEDEGGTRLDYNDAETLKCRVYNFLTTKGYSVVKDVPSELDRCCSLTLFLKGKFLDVNTTLDIDLVEGEYSINCIGISFYKERFLMPLKDIRVTGTVLDDRVLTALIYKLEYAIEELENDIRKFEEGEKNENWTD